MKYQLIIFDWDGTLFDSGAYIVKQFQDAARSLGLEEPDAKIIRSAIGLSLDKVLDRIMSNVSRDKVDAFIKLFRHNMETADNTPSLFMGAKDVLQQLHNDGYWLAVATGKRRRHLDQDLEYCDVSSLFMETRCGDEALSKPHPQMVLEILDALAVEPHKALMIGDTEYDVQAGLNAGTDVLAVNYGMHPESSLRKHAIQHCLSDIRELPDWLCALGMSGHHIEQGVGA